LQYLFLVSTLPPRTPSGATDVYFLQGSAGSPDLFGVFLIWLEHSTTKKNASKVARLRFAHLFVLPNHFGKVAFECLGFRWVLANVPRFFLAKNCPRFVHCFGLFF